MYYNEGGGVVVVDDDILPPTNPLSINRNSCYWIKQKRIDKEATDDGNGELILLFERQINALPDFLVPIKDEDNKVCVNRKFKRTPNEILRAILYLIMNSSRFAINFGPLCAKAQFLILLKWKVSSSNIFL